MLDYFPAKRNDQHTNILHPIYNVSFSYETIYFTQLLSNPIGKQSNFVGNLFGIYNWYELNTA